MDIVLEKLTMSLGLIGLIALLVGVLYLLFRLIESNYTKKFGRFSKEYLLKTYKLKRYSFLISLFYAVFFSAVIIVLSYAYSLFTEKKPLGSWLYDELLTHVAIFATLLLGCWGLVVSYNVLKQQNTQIVSFEEFLTELRDSLQRLKQKAEADEKKQFTVILYDYHPLIGNFSSKDKFDEFKEQLYDILKQQNVNFQFLTYHEDTLTSFFKKLSIDDDFKIVSNSYDSVQFIKNVENKTLDGNHSNATIWKSAHVSEFHFVIIDDEAYQYVVLPQATGINDIFGTKSEDPFIVNYLQNSFKEKLASIVSIRSIRHVGVKYHIRFEPQSNIKLIVLIDKDGETENIRDFLYLENGDIHGFEIDQNRLESLRFPIQYELHKTRNQRFVKSKQIFYREFFASRRKDHSVTFIIPPYDHPKKDELKYCFASLSDFVTNNKNQILSINIFFDPSSHERSNLINEFEKICKDYPTCYLCQIPEKSIAIEILSLSSNSMTASYSKNLGFRRTVVDYGDHQQYIYSAQSSNPAQSLKENIEEVYSGLFQVIENDGLKPHDIVRQWNYIGDITKANGNEDNYNVFCGIRSAFYKSNNLGQLDYPAATGIGFNAKNTMGINPNDFVLKVIAFTNTHSITSLQSSTQHLPYTYSSNVLKGPNVPMFERGKKVIFNDSSFHVYISGTSAVVGEDSYEPDDIKKQVEKTVESLFALLSTEDDKIISLRNLSYMKVFYSGASPEQLEVLKTYLGPIIKDIPHIYLRTQICRTNLNVEIEGAII